MVSESVRYLFYQPMDEKIKTWTLRFSAKENLIWRRHCWIGQSCCSMTSKRSIGWFLESSSGMKFFHQSVRLTNQKPHAFVSVRKTNQIALFPFVDCFCIVGVLLFQGHAKIALNSSVWKKCPVKLFSRSKLRPLLCGRCQRQSKHSHFPLAC